MRCPTCGTENEDLSLHCTGCGADLVATAPVLVLPEDVPGVTGAVQPAAGGPGVVLPPLHGHEAPPRREPPSFGGEPARLPTDENEAPARRDDAASGGGPVTRKPRRRWSTVLAAVLAVLGIAASAALFSQRVALSRQLATERGRVDALTSELTVAEGRARDLEGRVSGLNRENAALEGRVDATAKANRTLEGRVAACHAFLRKSVELYEANRMPTAGEDATVTTNVVKCFGGSFPVFLTP